MNMIHRTVMLALAACLLLSASGPTMPPGPWDEKPVAGEIEIPTCYPCGR